MAAYTQQQYVALCAGIAQGVTEVTYGDKKMVFRTLDEMLRTKTLMEKDLGIKVGSRKKFASFSKGLQ